jgi:DNA-binding PadR family transcriptional regulator
MYRPAIRWGMSELHEPSLLILTALAGGSRHGYGLIQAVGELSGGRLRLRPGTLYPALDRLTADGLIEQVHEEIVDGRLRRYYGLTDAGADRLETEEQRLRRNADAAAAALAERRVAARKPAVHPAVGRGPIPRPGLT